MKIETEKLNGFILTAEDLKLKGISRQNHEEKHLVFSDPSKISENPYDDKFVDGDFRVLSNKASDQNLDKKPKHNKDITFPDSNEPGDPQDNPH